jgi:hypothetical protein
MTEYEFVHHQGWREIGTKPASIWVMDATRSLSAMRKATGPITTNATATAWRCADPYPTEEGARRFLHNLGAVQDALETTPQHGGGRSGH